MTANERVHLLAIMGLGLVVILVVCQVEMRYRRRVRDERRALQRRVFDLKMGRGAK